MLLNNSDVGERVCFSARDVELAPHRTVSSPLKLVIIQSDAVAEQGLFCAVVFVSDKISVRFLVAIFG
ncbi:hypothetical protein sos41_32190 [Alphaproteobacteria bacterium SO-S41]|nr:hypothetical protein sos41_32190 [Alphaproteobacteria bacterium SO-S41]